MSSQAPQNLSPSSYTLEQILTPGFFNQFQSVDTIVDIISHFLPTFDDDTFKNQTSLIHASAKGPGLFSTRLVTPHQLQRCRDQAHSVQLAKDLSSQDLRLQFPCYIYIPDDLWLSNTTFATSPPTDLATLPTFAFTSFQGPFIALTHGHRFAGLKIGYETRDLQECIAQLYTQDLLWVVYLLPMSEFHTSSPLEFSSPFIGLLKSLDRTFILALVQTPNLVDTSIKPLSQEDSLLSFFNTFTLAQQKSLSTEGNMNMVSGLQFSKMLHHHLQGKSNVTMCELSNTFI